MLTQPNIETQKATSLFLYKTKVLTQKESVETYNSGQNTNCETAGAASLQFLSNDTKSPEVTKDQPSVQNLEDQINFFNLDEEDSEDEQDSEDGEDSADEESSDT